MQLAYGEGIVQVTNLCSIQGAAKAVVARKSCGPQSPYGFDSRPEHIMAKADFIVGLCFFV